MVRRVILFAVSRPRLSPGDSLSRPWITMWKYLPLVTNKLRDLWREWKRVPEGYNGYSMHQNDNGDEYKLYFISSNTFEHE